MELLTIIILILGGLFAGIINTIVGGGSLISVPLLITSGLPPHLAIGTNRFAMVFNTGVGAIDYHRRVKYNVKLALILASVASIGSYLGANVVLQITEGLLNYVIGILMLIMGAAIVFKKNLGLEETKLHLTNRNYVSTILISVVLGIYGGFFGAGISTMFTFMFVSFFGMSFLRSAGMTRLVVSVLSMIAVLVFLANMKIDFLFGMFLTISFIVGAKIGVRLALQVGNVWIRRMFIFLIALSSLKLFFF